MLRLLTIVFFGIAASADAAPRPWKNKEGTRAVRGDFVTRDDKTVTIRRSTDFKQIQLPLDKIHAEDLAWLNANHPLGGAAPAVQLAPDSKTDLKSIANLISYGDHFNDVMRKLKTCPLVKGTLNETYLARTGLDGIFHTVSSIAGGQYDLYFVWDENQKLKEFTFRSEAMKAEQLNDVILPRWKRAIDAVTLLYGPPAGANEKFDLNAIRNEKALYTHLWKNPVQGSVLVGAGRLEKEIFVQIHYTQQNIPVQTNPTPPPAP